LIEVYNGQDASTFVWLPPLATFTSALVVTRLAPTLGAVKSMASIRRVLNLFFISTLIWLIPSLVGAIVGQSQGGADEFVFGAFLVWAFELIVINGAFLISTSKSLFLASTHPFLVMLTVIEYTRASAYSAALGLVVLVSAVIYLSTLKHVRTKNGITSLRLLHAFLSTWVEREPQGLEQCFLMYAKIEPVETDAIVAKTRNGELAVVVPGIHPGPFAPVGSYNLSELIHKALHSESITPVVLHGTGGHERNLPTNDLAAKYAQLTKQFVDSLEVSTSGRLRGPLRSVVGTTNITTLLFGANLVAIISTAPFTSDDLNPASIVDATAAASELGLGLSIVDAHNSIGGTTRSQTAISKEDWRRILTNTLTLPDKPLSLGFTQSNTIGLKHGHDISEGGISVTLFSAGDEQSILVTADSNNAVSGLREEIAKSIEKMGLKFIELCTSDTHAFAARNLTERGYFALGESTKSADIIGAVGLLTRAALANTAPCTIRVARFKTEVPLIGQESLDAFAAVTAKAISVSKKYAETVAPMTLLFILIILFY